LGIPGIVETALFMADARIKRKLTAILIAATVIIIADWAFDCVAPYVLS
jgi:hypothetical protein